MHRDMIEYIENRWKGVGKTHWMLEAAKMALEEGKTVVIVAHTQRYGKELWSKLERHPNCRFLSITQGPESIYGYPHDTLFLVDHHAYYEAHQKALNSADDFRRRMMAAEAHERSLELRLRTAAESIEMMGSCIVGYKLEILQLQAKLAAKQPKSHWFKAFFGHAWPVVVAIFTFGGIMLLWALIMRSGL